MSRPRSGRDDPWSSSHRQDDLEETEGYHRHRIRWGSVPCNYPHLSTPNQRLAGFAQIVSLCAELFEGPPRQATLSGSNIDRSRNYNGPCGWSEMWVIARREPPSSPVDRSTGRQPAKRAGL